MYIVHDKTSNLAVAMTFAICFGPTDSSYININDDSGIQKCQKFKF